jgi:acyl-coenzyme A thioesterase PaaI-like protein
MIRKFQDSPPETSPIWLAKRRLAATLRDYANAIGNSGASESEIHSLAEIFEEKLPLLANGVATARDGDGTIEDELTDTVAPGMEDFYDRGPLTGQSNPIAPPAQLRVDVDARKVVGDVTFGRAFEGAPGCLHGGFVSSILDEALGMACIFAGGPAMTGELTVRFRKHTPIEVPLHIEARLDRVDGRKIETSGELLAGDVVVAEASGLFIGVSSEKFAALKQAQSEEGA